MSTCESLVALLKSILLPSPPGKELGSAALSSLSCRTYTLYITRARAKNTSRGLHFAFQTRIFYLSPTHFCPPSPLMPISMPAKRYLCRQAATRKDGSCGLPSPFNPSVTHVFHPALCTTNQWLCSRNTIVFPVRRAHCCRAFSPEQALNISVLTLAHGNEVTNGDPNKHLNISVLTPNPNFRNGVRRPEQALQHKRTDTDV